jgi:hypothetical protein
MTALWVALWAVIMIAGWLICAWAYRMDRAKGIQWKAKDWVVCSIGPALPVLQTAFLVMGLTTAIGIAHEVRTLRRWGWIK